MVLSNQFDAYRGSHKPDVDEVVRFHELDRAMPNFYETPHHYIHDHDGSDFYGAKEAKKSASAARGNPDADVRIYRAVPNNIETINPGDWVTTSNRYAEHHGQSNLPEGVGSHVLRATTKAKHIVFGGNDGYEFGYAGTEQLPHDPR